MSDEKLREAYERGLPSGDGRPPLDDVEAERLRRLVEREGSEEDRLRALDALLSTAEGRRELELLWGASRAARPRRRLHPAWLAAASVLVVAGLSATWVATREPEAVLRGEESPITLVAPRGARAADDASRFTWRRLRDAERYTMVLVDASSGDEVYATETRDTSVALPDSVRLEAGRTYLWWVQARMPLGASVTAVTERVTITER